jgi:hypothetical protein
MERQGRHRYHRLATPAIAQLVEGMMTVAATASSRERAPHRIGPKDQAMRHARTCYDHLAGRVAVAVADKMIARGEIELSADGGEMTASGAALLSGMGVDLTQRDTRGRRRRVFCRPCLDWSERRHHVAGFVGALLYDHFLAKSWIRTVPDSRAVTVTLAGQRNLTAHFDLDPILWCQPTI